MTKTCRDCPSTVLVPRGPGGGFRNQCHACWARSQRESWAANRGSRLIRSRANYRKHADKRRQESAAYKKANREYYALAEWFRKKRIPISHIPRGDLQALVEMKQALNRSRDLVRKQP